jgi:CubicO group peptidase (beta-lactamase class C family)
MATSIPTEAATTLRTYIDNATTGSSSSIPGAVVHIVNAQANTIFSHGSSNLATPTVHSIGIIQSLTKIVGSVAFLQLVERGLTSLDDPTIVPIHLPELAAKKVLTGYTTGSDGKRTWQFEDRVGDITPRMLMNHTYGGGHTYMNELLFAYLQDQEDVDWAATNEATDPYGIVLASPLLWQPGTKTNYAQGLDWLAVLIERLTKQSLASYLQENIFDPLGLRSMGFEPCFGGTSLSHEFNQGKFWPRVLRTADGYMTLDPPVPETHTRADAFPNGSHHTGCLGTGLVSSATDYARLVTIFLNSGVDSVTGHRILSPESIKEISSPSLPAVIQNNSRNIPASTATPIILPAMLESPHMDPKGSYGLGCGVQGADRVMADGTKGRSERSVYWYGAANTEFWIDLKKQIVVFVNGNYYPWNDDAWVKFVAGVEGLLYKNLTE